MFERLPDRSSHNRLVKYAVIMLALLALMESLLLFLQQEILRESLRQKRAKFASKFKGHPILTSILLIHYDRFSQLGIHLLPYELSYELREQRIERLLGWLDDLLEVCYDLKAKDLRAVIQLLFWAFTHF